MRKPPPSALSIFSLRALPTPRSALSERLKQVSLLQKYLQEPTDNTKASDHGGPSQQILNKYVITNHSQG